MTRLATCSDGVRLVRCGNRVQLCGDAGLTCGTEAAWYNCATPRANVELGQAIVPGHLFTFRAATAGVQVIADFTLGGGYPGTYTETLNTTVQFDGVFGLAVQWGRPPTVPEVYSEHNLASGYDSVTVGEPRPVGPSAFGRFFYAWAGSPAYQLYADSPAALGFTAADRTNVDGNPLGVAYQVNVATVSRCTLSIITRAAQGVEDHTFERVLGDSSEGRYEAGTERYDIEGDGWQWPGYTDGIRQNLPDGALISGSYTRTFAQVDRVGDPVNLPSNWEGPPNGLVCPDEPAPASADPNAEAIAATLEADPLRRGGCCG